jgi:hypothetical protein
MSSRIKKTMSRETLVIVFTLAMLGVSGCATLATPISTPIATVTFPVAVPTKLPNPTSSPDMLEICPVLQPLSKNMPITGSLFFLDYPSQHIVSFPQFTKTEILQGEIITDGYTSPNGQYFSTVGTKYDASGNYVGDFLEILNNKGETISSEAWKDEWVGSPIWINSDEIVFHTTQANALITYNPFSKITTKKNFNFPIEENTEVEAVDPFFQLAVYSYADPSAIGGINDRNRLSIWDEKNHKEILNLANQYSSLVTRVALSSNTRNIAITTVTPGETKNHSEILLVDSLKGTYEQISDFRSQFEEITITDLQWSPDGKVIYFWAITDDSGLPNTPALYSFDLQSKQIRHFCFEGNQDQANSLIWITSAPEFFFLTNVGSPGNKTPSNNIHKSILLIDLKNNKAYEVIEDVSAIGWLDSEK